MPIIVSVLGDSQYIYDEDPASSIVHRVIIPIDTAFQKKNYVAMQNFLCRESGATIVNYFNPQHNIWARLSSEIDYATFVSVCKKNSEIHARATMM